MFFQKVKRVIAMEKVRIAVFGLNQGYKFAVDALHMPDVELVAVAGVDELAEKRAKELHKPLYRNVGDLVNKVEIDGAIIALPNRLHREAAQICADKKIDILLEKPIADTVADGQAIIDVCKKDGVKLLIGHHRRCSSKMMKLKEIIASKEIGDLVGIHFMWAIAKDRPYFNIPWRVAPGGGPLLINAIHDIDDLRFTTGLKISKVFAVARNNIRHKPVEDSVSIVLESEDGPTATYFVSDGTPSPWNYEMTAGESNQSIKFVEKTDCYTFLGTKGSLGFPSMNLYYYDENHYGWYEPIRVKHLDVPPNDPLTAELHHFISVIRGEADPVCPGDDALETLKVILAIKKSAETGDPVLV